MPLACQVGFWVLVFGIFAKKRSINFQQQLFNSNSLKNLVFGLIGLCRKPKQNAYKD
jgi:hypothetical protein